MKTMNAAAAALLTAAVALPALAADKYHGCYTPLYGFAKSLCTDNETCSSQTGLYRVVLRNEHAPIGKRKLVLSGMFQGLNVTPDPNHIAECVAVSQTTHLLMDKNMAGTLETGPDDVCLTGGGDMVNTIEVVERMAMSGGQGIYSNVIPGGTVTITGTIHRNTGINSFKVTPQPGDEVCFKS